MIFHEFVDFNKILHTFEFFYIKKSLIFFYFLEKCNYIEVYSISCYQLSYVTVRDDKNMNYFSCSYELVPQNVCIYALSKIFLLIIIFNNINLCCKRAKESLSLGYSSGQCLSRERYSSPKTSVRDDRVPCRAQKLYFILVLHYFFLLLRCVYRTMILIVYQSSRLIRPFQFF